MPNIVEIAGAKVLSRVDGTGPALLLLHGIGGNSETNWGPVVDRLSQSHTVIRPDFPGSGETKDDGRPLTIGMFAKHAVAAAQSAGATTFDVVGFSMGASVAIQIATEFPDLVRSVISLAGFAALEDERQVMQFNLWRDLVRTDRGAMARLLLLTGLSPEFLADMEPDAARAAVANIVETNNWDGMARQIDLGLSVDVRAQAARITQPTLVIGCVQDQMVPPAHSRSLATVIPGAVYREIDTGHLAAVEKPDQTAQMILDFVADPEAARRLG